MSVAVRGVGVPHWVVAHDAEGLAPGLAEGRLHLAAYALGASASGMTFIDSEMAAAGPPGAPSRVRIAAPRS